MTVLGGGLHPTASGDVKYKFKYNKKNTQLCMRTAN